MRRFKGWIERSKHRIRGLTIDRTQLLCVAVSVLAALMYVYAQRMDEPLKDGGIIERGSYGEGSREYELYVSGIAAEPRLISFSVSEQLYGDEELQALFESLSEALPTIIAPEGQDLGNISKDLELPKEVQGYEGIRLSWYPEDAELISYEGEIMAGGVEAETQTGISVVMKYQDISAEYYYRLRLVPKEYTKEEQRLIKLMDEIEKADDRDRSSGNLRLPSEVEGRSLSYSIGQDRTPVLIIAMGVLAALLLRMRPVEAERKRKREREEALLRDYPDLVSRLLLYIGAGLTIKNSWVRICREYEDIMTGEGTNDARTKKLHESPLKEEMLKTLHDMEKGVPESQAYTEFGRSCGIRCCQRLATLLEQNRRNGDKSLRDILSLEMEEAFELRKNRALRAGQEASAKLMLPLFMSFGAVILIVMAPSMMSIA